MTTACNPALSTLRAVVRAQLQESWQSDLTQLPQLLQYLHRQAVAQLRQDPSSAQSANWADLAELEALQFADFNDVNNEDAIHAFVTRVRAAGFKLLGEGSFRITFAPPGDADLVLKIGKYSAGLEMNRDEMSLGKNSSLIWLFPKVYANGPQGLWILQEAVLPANRHAKAFLKRANLDFELGRGGRPARLRSGDDWLDLMMLLEVTTTKIVKNLAAAHKLLLSFQSLDTFLQRNLHTELKALEELQLWHRWARVAAQLSIDLADLRLENMGLSRDDGRILLLDSSRMTSGGL